MQTQEKPRRRILSIEARGSTLLKIFTVLEEKGVEVKNLSTAMLSFINLHLEPYNIFVPPDEAKCEALLAEKVKLSGHMRNERIRAQQHSAHTTVSNGQKATREAKENLSRALTDSDFSPIHVMDPAKPMPSETTLQFGERLHSNFEANLVDVDDLLRKAKEMPIEDIYPSSKPAINGFDDLEEIIKGVLEEQKLEEEIDLLSKITIGNIEDLPMVAIKKQTPKALDIRDPRLKDDKLWKTFSGEADEAKMFALRIVYYNLPEEYWSSKKAEEMLLYILNNLP